VVESTRDTPESRCEPFEFAKPGQKYLVFIEGATHSSYGGYARARSRADEDAGDVGMISRVTTCSVHAFLDSTLLGDEQAGAYLAGERLVELSKGKDDVQAEVRQGTLLNAGMPQRHGASDIGQ
jgi:hypothetical protein